MPEKSVKRLEALKERQLVNERRVKKSIEDSKKELKQLEDSSAKLSAAAETEMLKLTENLQRSLQNRSVLEAKVAEMRPAQRGQVARRRDAEERAWSLLRDAQLLEEELCDLQKILKAKGEEKEQRLHQLQQQREEVTRLSEEASKDASEAATLEAETTQLKAKAAEEVQRELAVDRALTARRTFLQRQMFQGLAAFVYERKNEEKDRRRRELSWFSAKAPVLLRAWHSRASQLRALRQDMEATDAAQLKKLFDTWAEHLQEERLWRRFARRVSQWHRKHVLRRVHALWRFGVTQTKREASWPHDRTLLLDVVQNWQQASLAELWLQERLVWGDEICASKLLPRALRVWREVWQVTRARAARLVECSSSHRRKHLLRSWRCSWLCRRGLQGPLKVLGRRCLKRAFWAFQTNVILVFLQQRSAGRLKRNAFQAFQRMHKNKDKAVLPVRRILVVWGWWRFLAKQSLNLKVRQQSWTRSSLQKRVQRWQLFAQMTRKRKRDAWKRFCTRCRSSLRRRILFERYRLRQTRKQLHRSFIGFLSCWVQAARRKRQALRNAQEECQALVQHLQLADERSKEMQERRLSEQAAMEELMTEKRLLEFFHCHMQHELACHQKVQHQSEALVASQTFELQEELRMTCSSQATLEGLLKNEEQRIEAFQAEERELIQAPIKSRLKEMQAAAEAKLKEKEEEVRALRQSVLRSCSQSQLRVKMTSS